jgi:hypothetical protein
MPLSREKDDTGLVLSLLPASSHPPAVRQAAWWRRVDLPPFELPWLDEAKLGQLGFDLDAMGHRAPAAHDPADAAGALPRYAFVVLEQDGPAWAAWLAAQEARTERDEALASIDRIARSRLVPVDAGLDPLALRAEYPDAARYAVVPATIGVRIATAPGGIRSVRGSILRLRAGGVPVPLSMLPRLEPFIPRVDANESARRARQARDAGWPAAQAPRYRATVAFGRDGRPRLAGVTPIGAP